MYNTVFCRPEDRVGIDRVLRELGDTAIGDYRVEVSTVLGRAAIDAELRRAGIDIERRDVYSVLDTRADHHERMARAAGFPKSVNGRLPEIIGAITKYGDIFNMTTADAIVGVSK